MAMQEEEGEKRKCSMTKTIGEKVDKWLLFLKQKSP
jgi:hypothetical protein